MADDLDENFEIEPEERDDDEDEDEDDDDDMVNEEETQKNGVKLKNVSQTDSKRKRKKKNITEILELKKSDFAKASYAANEFKKILIEYANKKLSSVEKNELGLGSNDISDRLDKMMLKRKKTHSLDVAIQFKKKLAKKLRLLFFDKIIVSFKKRK